jgi:hypothetical protein
MTDTKTIIYKLKAKGETEAAERMENLYQSNLHLLEVVKIATMEATKAAQEKENKNAK